MKPTKCQIDEACEDYLASNGAYTQLDAISAAFKAGCAWMATQTFSVAQNPVNGLGMAENGIPEPSWIEAAANLIVHDAIHHGIDGAKFAECIRRHLPKGRYIDDHQEMAMMMANKHNYEDGTPDRSREGIGAAAREIDNAISSQFSIYSFQWIGKLTEIISKHCVGRASISEVRGQRDRTIRRAEAGEARARNLQADLRAAEAKIDDLKAGIEQANEEIKELNVECNEYESRLKGAPMPIKVQLNDDGTWHTI